MTQPALATPPYLSHRRRAVFLIALVTIPLLLLFLGTGDPVDMMELFNLNPVREAFRDGHWLMPTLNGEPRLEKPPLPVWIPAAARHALSLRKPVAPPPPLHSHGTAHQLRHLWYRLHPLRKPRRYPPQPRHRQTALLAALLLPAMLMFNRESRLATYDIYATAFLTCGTFSSSNSPTPATPKIKNQKSLRTRPRPPASRWGSLCSPKAPSPPPPSCSRWASGCSSTTAA